jgi:hypothetical protein
VHTTTAQPKVAFPAKMFYSRLQFISTGHSEKSASPKKKQ